MPLLIAHMSALDFWRIAYPADRAPDRCAALAMPAGAAIATEEAVWSVAPPVITPGLLAPEGGVLHILVRSRGERRRSNSHLCHVWQPEVPGNAFYRLADDAYVASPPFVFLQIAQTLSFPQLIALAHELCGLYAHDEAAEFGMRQRSVPLATAQELRTFVRECEALGGAPANCTKKALRALDHVTERSASPRETMLVMLLTLPCRHGGYGLPRPLMNHEIPLTPEAAHIARRRKLRADLFWDEAGLVMEFNGELPHSGEAAGFSDRARTNALEIMGYSVREITRLQLDDFDAFESMALHTASLLGHRVRMQQRGALPARTELRRALLEWTRAQGRPA